MSTAERRMRELREREDRLLSAAVALLDCDDWQAVTVEQIADRAEYAKGTVYRHFASKDDLHARLAATWNAGTAAELGAVEADQPFDAVLRAVVAVLWRRQTGDRVYARLIRHVQNPDFLARLAPETRAALAEADARILDILAGLLDLGVTEGTVPAAPLEQQLFIISAMVTGALRLEPMWTGPGGVGDPETVVTDAILAALGCTRGAGDRAPEAG